MNPGYNDINYQVILNNAKILDIPITVFKSEIFDTVADIEESPCYLCARMRRGYLYSKAKELGCNKIALGHHYDDVIETILMGMLYGAQIQTMMPKLHSTNFEGMELIRPLYLIREADIIHWRDYNNLAFIQCACRLTESCASCGGTEKGSKRGEIKQLIKDLTKVSPYIEKNIFRSVENVNLDTVIAYKQYGVKHNFLERYDEMGRLNGASGSQTADNKEMEYNCDYCNNLVYDEEIEGYVCDVDMDEDDYARLLSSSYKQCPYYQSNDEYKIVRHQM